LDLGFNSGKWGGATRLQDQAVWFQTRVWHLFWKRCFWW